MPDAATIVWLTPGFAPAASGICAAGSVSISAHARTIEFETVLIIALPSMNDIASARTTVRHGQCEGRARSPPPTALVQHSYAIRTPACGGKMNQP